MLKWIILLKDLRGENIEIILKNNDRENKYYTCNITNYFTVSNCSCSLSAESLQTIVGLNLKLD